MSELEWAGDGTQNISGVPADDLTEHDIDRLVYIRTAGSLPDPEQEGAFLVRGLEAGDEEFREVRRQLVKDLTASGLYRKSKKSEPNKDSEKDEPEKASEPEVEKGT